MKRTFIFLLVVVMVSIGVISISYANQTYSDGTYLVGVDVAPGLYRVILTDLIMNMGYLERIKAVSFSFDDIIANEMITGNSYIDIKSSDFAIRVQGVKLTFIE